MSFRVVNTAPLDPVCVQWLEERVDLKDCDHRDQQELHELLGSADALVIGTYLQVNAALLDLAPKLKVVGRAGVGLEHVDLAECRRRKLPVVHTPEANTQAVVEYVVALILDALRPRPALDSSVDTELYLSLRRTEVGQQLDQLTLGILGFGRIGKRLGAVAHAIGMNVIVNDVLSEKELRATVDYPFQWVEKTELYQQCDVLSLHVDGRAENRHLIGSPQLSQLRPHCLIVNAARGMIMDESALVQWAQQTKQQGGQAVLDVVDPEPPSADCPLLELSNVRVLPHLAARTYPALQSMGWVVRDVWSVLQGERPHYPAW